MTKPMFNLCFVVDAEVMAEMIIEYGTRLHHVEVVTGAEPAPVKRRRVARVDASTFLTLAKVPNERKSIARTAEIALLCAASLGADGKKFRRDALTKMTADMMTGKGLAATSASPSISELLNGGYLVVCDG